MTESVSDLDDTIHTNIRGLAQYGTTYAIYLKFLFQTDLTHYIFKLIRFNSKSIF